VLKGFRVDGFWWALIGALAYSVISGLLSMIVR
jgi:putative membrane protein